MLLETIVRRSQRFAGIFERLVNTCIMWKRTSYQFFRVHVNVEKVLMKFMLPMSANLAALVMYYDLVESIPFNP